MRRQKIICCHILLGEIIEDSAGYFRLNLKHERMTAFELLKIRDDINEFVINHQLNHDKYELK